jgi:type VI secretion system secreted protein VgrG
VVLGGAGVTCTRSTVGLGAVGSKLTVTQTPNCSIAGAVHQRDATAVSGFGAFDTAYTALNALTCPPANNLTGQALGGKTLAPGVYCFNTRAALATGILTLAGPSSGVWVFQVGTGLTTGPAQVVMAGGGQACNVYWALGKAGTIGTGSKFLGNVMAGSAVTFTGTGSSLVGRALARTAVTMTGASLRLPSNWNTSTCRQTP